ncbi:hypothetical protein ABW21_db0203531 [Orbilia brochopaga]|nr:hypothetical protein ABW21_db0203531 [Drechslerella brochopaga]
MIYDDVDQDWIWKIYYDMIYPDKGNVYIREYVLKLLEWSKDLESWLASDVGRFLQIGSIKTFEAVRKVWSSWLKVVTKISNQKELSATFRRGMRATKKTWHEQQQAENLLRPVGTLSSKILTPFLEYLEHYWDPKTLGNWTRTDGIITANVTLAFSKFGSRFKVHYETNPLSGFHLATAFTPLETGAKSSNVPPSYQPRTYKPLVAAANQEFKMWCQAFQCIRKAENVRVCFFVDDSLDLCNNLLGRFLRATKLPESPPTPPEMITLAHLSQSDATSKGYYFRAGIPCQYNVIDASNLIDELGVYNVLLATAPLLHNDFTSSLYTQTLLSDQFDPKKGEKALCELFGADPVFIFLLLGIAPMDYVSGLTGQSHASEDLLSKFSANHKVHGRLVWKKLLPFQQEGMKDFDLSCFPKADFMYDTAKMAAILINIYNKMFEAENLSAKPAKPQVEGRKKKKKSTRAQPVQHCTHATFSMLLYRLKSMTSLAMDWDSFMERFMNYLASSSSKGVASWHQREQGVMNQVFGVYEGTPSTVPSPQQIAKDAGICDDYQLLFSGFHECDQDYPSVTCLSIAVPIRKFSTLFDEMDAQNLATLSFKIALRRTDRKDDDLTEYFGALRQRFGRLREYESTKDEAVLNVEEGSPVFVEDPKGWRGKGDVIFSCLVPTAWLTKVPWRAVLFVVTTPTTKVCKTSRGPVHTVYRFGGDIDDDRKVRLSTDFPRREFTGDTLPWIDIQSAKSDSIHIEATECHESNKENQSNNGQAPLTDGTEGSDLDTEESDPDTFELVIGPEPHYLIERMVYCMPVTDEAELAELLEGEIKMSAMKSSETTVIMKIGSTSHTVVFPYTIGDEIKLGFSGAYQCIELDAPVASISNQENIARYIRFPVGTSEVYKPSAACWSLHRVNPDASPMVTTDGKDTDRYEWIKTTFNLMFSPKERIDRDATFEMMEVYLGDTLIELKDTIFNMAMEQAQVPGKRGSFFMLHDQENLGKAYMLIYVKAIRFDLHGNTMFLDGALVPLVRGELAQLAPHVGALMRARCLTQIHTSNRQTKLWMQLSASMVERYRTWRHTDRCEYYKSEKVPLSAPGLWIGAPYICGCGKGIFPESFREDPLLTPFLAQATRIALGPIFSAPCSQPAEDFKKFKKVVEDWIKASEAPEIAAKETKCRICNKSGSKEEGLVGCPRCQKVRYCSKLCQKKDWKDHKLECAP